MKTKILLFLTIFISLFINAAGQIPAGYYSTAAGKTGDTLRAALRDITSGGHVKLPYTSSAFDVWDAFSFTDVRPSPNNTVIWDMYSDIPGGSPAYTFTLYAEQCGYATAEGDCYAREHCMPNSWWGGLDDASNPQYTDLHHLFPADQYVNIMKSANPLGQAIAPVWTSSDGSRVGPCSYPGYTGTVFEPIDEYKGDFARAFFYIASRYMNCLGSWVNSYPGTDAQYVIEASVNNFKPWFINMLLSWHYADPVSQKEIDRNNAVYYNTPQHNRNPYIDHPEYACLVWGSNCISPPLISFIAHSPANPIPADTVMVSCQISDDGLVQYAICYWDSVPGSFSNSLSMSLTSAPAYETDIAIPAHAEGNNIYYKIVATDNDGNSATSDIFTYNIPQGEPTNHPADFTCDTTSSSSITLSWTDATGTIIPDSYLIKASSTGFASITDPSDSVPEINSSLVKNVAAGVETCTFTGLTALTTYYFKIFPASNPGTNIDYKTDGTVAADSCSTTTATGTSTCVSEGFDAGLTVPQGWTFTNIGGTYTSSSNYGVASPSLKMDAVGDIIITPAAANALELSFWIKGQLTDAASALKVEGYNGGWYVIDSIYNLPTSGTVKTYNSGTSPALAPGFSQFRFSYYKSAGNLSFDDVNVLCLANCTSPSAQAKTLQFPSVASTSMLVKWTRGTGNSVVVIAKSGSAVNITPVDGTGYSGNETFGLGEQLGTGNYVVYEGTASSVLVTGLTADTTYHFAVYEYNSAEFCYKTPALTGSQTTAPTPVIPTLTTSAITGITVTSAGSGGIITADGGSPVTARGVCLNTTGLPTTADNKTTDGTGTGSYTSNITGLTSGTTYYVRAYATNADGTSYGDELMFAALRYEPSNHPSDFACGTTTTTAIPLSWTGASGSVLPHGYLIKASPVGFSSITDPVDGVSEADGPLTKNIAFGTNSYTFTGLNSNSDYYFKIYSYTNSNADINYKTDDTIQSTNCSTIAVSTLIACQGFEGSAADTWNYTTTGGISSWMKYKGAKSGSLYSRDTLLLSNTDISTYSGVSLSIAFAAISISTGENLYLEISYDNGITWNGTGSDSLITGNGNDNYLAFGATSNNHPITVSANPWVISIPDSASQISIRIITSSLPWGTQCFVDEIKLNGIYICTYPTTYDVTGGGSYCSGGSGMTVGLSNSDTGINYLLMLSGTPVGSPVAGTGSAVSFGLQTTAGSYYVTATNPSTSCSSNMNGAAVVIVNPLNPASVIIAVNPSAAICTGESVVFTATAINGGASPAYQWKKGGINITGETGSIYTTSSLADGDTITCQMTSNAVCVSGSPATSNIITMTVNPYLPASVSITASPATTICQGDNVGFTATPVNGGTPSYQWKLNGANVGTNSSIYSASTLNNNDTVLCIMTASGGCFTGSPDTSGIIIMSVNALQAVSVSIAANPSGAVVAGTNVTFTAAPLNGGTNPAFQWKKNGVNISNATNSTYSDNALVNGDTVSCVLTSNIACATGSPATSGSIAMTVIPVTPVISNVQKSPASPYSTDTVIISADVTDDALVSNVTLKWCTDGISFGNAIAMNPGTPPSYFTASAIPAQLAGTTVSFKIIAVDNSSNSDSSSVFSYTVWKPEADNHVSAFICGAAGSTSIPLTWNDAGSGILPDAYLIKGSSISQGSVTDPTDGVPVADGALTQNVTQGTQAFTFNGLSSSTTYYFKIYPYTNSGVNINYKTTATVPNTSCSTNACTGGSPTTVFSENMGSPSGTLTIAAHESADGFQNTSYTMTSGGAANPGDVRITSASYNYTGASGNGNIYFSSVSGEYGFAVEGIDASAYTSLSVQFGYMKTSASALPALALDYWDGSVYVNVPFTFNEPANASAVWYLSPVISLPSAAQISGLKLRWVKTGAVAVRIDDVIMIGTPAPLYPAAYNVTGGGSYCSGGSGVAIGLDNSQTGINYQLKLGGIDSGSPVAGTGSSFSFGNQTAGGNYSVSAVNATTGCNSTMNGSASITVNPLPVLYNIIGGGSYCSENSAPALALNGSETGVNYRLLVDGSPLWNPLNGTGDSLDFGNQAAAGTYSVSATNAVTSCQQTMTGTATVSIYNCPASGKSFALNKTGAPADTSAILDISDTKSGVLFPRLSDTERDNLISPAAGLIIYNTDSNKFNYYNNGWYQVNSSLVSATTGTNTITYGTAINSNGAPPSPSAILDISSSTKGALIPRTLPGAVYGAKEGSIIFNSYTNKINYFNGAAWVALTGELVSLTTGAGAQTSNGFAINLVNSAPDSSAILDISAQNKALLIPRISDAQRNDILPATGLMIYNTTSNELQYYNGTGGWFSMQ